MADALRTRAPISLVVTISMHDAAGLAPGRLLRCHLTRVDPILIYLSPGGVAWMGSGGIGVYNTQKLSNPSNSRESNNEERD